MSFHCADRQGLRSLAHGQPTMSLYGCLATTATSSAADAAYYASSARQRLDPDPAELIEASDERTVERVI